MVPNQPMSIFNQITKSGGQIDIWKHSRKEFAKEPIFKSRKVKLREIRPGETRELRIGNGRRGLLPILPSEARAGDRRIEVQRIVTDWLTLLLFP